VTKTLNTTAGLPIGWRVYANDTSNNWNASQIFTVMTDEPPKYYNNSTNNTAAGQPTKFSLNWTDNSGLSGYVFQFCNGTWNGTYCLGMPADWLSGWSYRKNHIITNSTGTDVNYTIGITIINGTGTDSSSTDTL
jgi:hypothetical protein